MLPMSTICNVLLFTAVFMQKGESIESKPNIIFLWFDDLGFTDVGFNGGTYPTPVLDQLVSDKAIKLNSHYCEAVCSPSRSSLFTGKYSWLTGITTTTGSHSHRHVARNLTFYTQLLQNDGYNTFIAGKWHIGYKYSDILPGAKGFDEGIYSYLPSGYNSRGSKVKLTSYHDEYPTSNSRTIHRQNALFPDGKLPVHDTWGINNGDPVPMYFENTEYCDSLYSENIIDFIGRQTALNPFYIHYSLFTPHRKLVEPPALRPYFAYDYDICNIATLSAETQLLCRVILYAQEKIEEIINKTKSMGLYDDTIIVITSDNGPGDLGTALPLRGRKSSLNEGGLKTPTFIIGGYIENVLNNLQTPTSYCEYNEMVHISDWYNIFTDIANISHNISDSDHSNLQIWDDIKCACDDLCNENYEKRTELITMRLCGDDYSVNYPDKTFYASMIIKKPWKLIVNGSYSIDESCPIGAEAVALPRRNTYIGHDDENSYSIPNQTFFDKWYNPQVTAPNRRRGNILFRSECLDALNGTDTINNESFSQFQQGEFTLYNIETDKIEACNVAAFESGKVNELWAELQDRSTEYNAAQKTLASVGSMWAQINSYNCSSNTTYIVPWEGENESKCGAVGQTMNDVSARDCGVIWRRLNNLKHNCNRRRRLVNDDDRPTPALITRLQNIFNLSLL